MSEPVVRISESLLEAQAARPTAVTVRAARRYRAAAHRVFDAWLRPEIAVRWLFATASRPLARAEIDARVGGRFRLVEAGRAGVTEWTGEYLAIERHRRLIFTLWIPPEPVATRVAVEIADADRGCRLTLRQQGLPRSLARQVRQRWIGILYGLDVTLRAPTSGAWAALASGAGSAERSHREPVAA